MVLVFFTIKIFIFSKWIQQIIVIKNRRKTSHKAHIKMFIYRMKNEANMWFFSTSITNWMHKTALKNEKNLLHMGLIIHFCVHFLVGICLIFKKKIAKSLYPTIHIQHMYVVTFANSLCKLLHCAAILKLCMRQALSKMSLMLY
jgi:hypothetical protein